MNESLTEILRLLPARVCSAVLSLPERMAEEISEIRLRSNSPVSLTTPSGNLFLGQNGITDLRNSLFCTQREIDDCISWLTGGSLYTCDEFLTRGFIPLANGARAGICGRALISGGRLTGFSEVSSVVLRVSRFIESCAVPLAERFFREGICGTLVCSPPAMGKTTFLRSIAYLLAVGKYTPPTRVAIADERCELSVGIPKNGLIDILRGVPKGDAIELLTRNLSPSVIVCDEIGPDEVDSVLEAQSSGVSLIASAHCREYTDLNKRGRMSRLINEGVFSLAVSLKSPAESPTVMKIGVEI